MMETNEIGVVNSPNGQALVLKHENKGFFKMNQYLTLFSGLGYKCFSDMIDGKENLINDSINIFLNVTDESVKNVQIYGKDAAKNYKSGLFLNQNTYNNVQPAISLVFGLLGNSNTSSNEQFMGGEEKTKNKLGLIPDRKDYSIREYRKVIKEDNLKENKKMRLDEMIKFVDIKEFEYELKPRHTLNKDEYQKMEFLNDNKKIFSLGGSELFKAQLSKFRHGGKEFVISRYSDEFFETKTFFDACEKMYDFNSLLERLMKDYNLYINKIYFETDIEKEKNNSEICPYPQDTFVEIKEGDKSGIVYAYDKLPFFLHFTRDLNIKINKKEIKDSPSIV